MDEASWKTWDGPTGGVRFIFFVWGGRGGVGVCFFKKKPILILRSQVIQL